MLKFRISLLIVFAGLASLAATNPPSRLEFLRSRYEEAHKQNRLHLESISAGLQLAEAAFHLADFVSSDEERAQLAEEAIHVCRRILRQESTNASAHYFLAMNLGQVARTRTLGALKMLPEMETEFKAALQYNPLVDYAGPHRSLGMLYRDAPGWPLSIGDKTKARQHLEKATELCPIFPDNWLSLLEAYLSWGEKSKALEVWKKCPPHFAAAQSKFTGEDWTQAWKDWEKRLEAIAAKLQVKRFETPKSKD